METVRVFIAIDFNEKIRTRLFELQRKLKKTHADVRWVKPHAMHLTLAFLGEVEEDRIEPIKTALDQALQARAPFELKVHGTGTFGHSRHPRVIWAGIEPCPALLEAQQKIIDALRTENSAFDEKPFSPHLTLGRVKSAAHLPSLMQKLEKAAEIELGGTTITEILLFQSERTARGTEHAVLHRIPLT